MQFSLGGEIEGIVGEEQVEPEAKSCRELFPNTMLYSTVLVYDVQCNGVAGKDEENWDRHGSQQ